MNEEENQVAKQLGIDLAGYDEIINIVKKALAPHVAFNDKVNEIEVEMKPTALSASIECIETLTGKQAFFFGLTYEDTIDCAVELLLADYENKLQGGAMKK